MEPEPFYELQWTTTNSGKLIIQHDMEQFFQREAFENLPKFATPQCPYEEESMEIDSLSTLEEQLAHAPQSTQKGQVHAVL